MKLISMFLASMRIARELDRTRCVADPERTEALVGEICGGSRLETVIDDENSATERSLPHPA